MTDDELAMEILISARCEVPLQPSVYDDLHQWRNVVANAYWFLREDPTTSEKTLQILRDGMVDANKLLEKVNDNKPPQGIQSGIAMQMAVTPGEAHLEPDDYIYRASAEYCTETGIPVEQCFHCLCEDPEEPSQPDTMPTGFPAAPAAPEVCKLAYYGIDCTGCLKHPQGKRLR